jgi:PTH1 family peptidyl-tRNA hydrolase
MLRSLLDFLLGRLRGPSDHSEPAPPATEAAEQALSSDASDSAPVKVILGLGNPGQEFERTRHNVGWWVVDHLADAWHFSPWKKDGDARVASGVVGSHRVRLVKPLTYMNLSGAVVRPYLRRDGWSPSNDLIVVVDDVALPVGRFRFRARGSAGGHNGLKSIEATIGNQDYARLRIGIAPSTQRSRGNLADYVLSDFDEAEAAAIRELLPAHVDALELWLRDGIAQVMTRFNRQGEVP